MQQEIYTRQQLEETCQGKNAPYDIREDSDAIETLSPEQQIKLYAQSLWNFAEGLFPYDEQTTGPIIKLQLRRSRLVELGLANEIIEREENPEITILRKYEDGHQDYNTMTIRRTPDSFIFGQTYKLQLQDTLEHQQLPITMDFQLAEELTLQRQPGNYIQYATQRGKRLRRVHVFDITSPDYDVPFKLEPIDTTPESLKRALTVLEETVPPNGGT